MTVSVRKDGKERAFTFTTPLAPQAVFDYLSDFTRHPEWCRDLVEMEQQGEGPPGVGTRYRTLETMREGAKTKDTTFCEITALEAPRRIEWRARTANEKGPMAMRSHWSFEIEPEGSGSRVTQRYGFDPPNVGSKLMLAGFLPFADLMGGMGASPKNVRKHAQSLEERLAAMASGR
jgi:uncharacterized protein YndB with AHSA1/START domain